MLFSPSKTLFLIQFAGPPFDKLTKALKTQKLNVKKRCAFDRFVYYKNKKAFQHWNAFALFIDVQVIIQGIVCQAYYVLAI